MGRFWARCKLGSDLKPRSIIHVMNLGLVGAAIYRAILIDQHSLRSHPNKAVDVVVCQTFWKALWFPRHQLLSVCSLILSSETNRLESSSPFRPLPLSPGPATPPPPALSPQPWHCAAAHIPLHSPTCCAARRP